MDEQHPDDDDDVIRAELAKLVPAYVAARRRDAIELRSLLADHRLDEMRRIAHRMKGTGTSYGLPEITRLGGALETAAESADDNALRALLDHLEAALAAC